MNREEKIMAAADLRNAAMVMAELGFTTDQFVNPMTSTICTDGAIRLAITHKLTYVPNGINGPKEPQFVWSDDFVLGEDGWGHSELFRELESRRNNALEALADVLGNTCTCGACGTHTFDALTPKLRVYHFNDFVCDGGDEAIALMIQAAEKLEAEF